VSAQAFGERASMILFPSYRQLLLTCHEADVRAAHDAWLLPFNTRTWRHYLDGDSLPNALVSAVLDAELGLAIERQAEALRNDCGTRLASVTPKRQKVVKPLNFTARTFAALLKSRRNAIGHTWAESTAYLPAWWPDILTVDAGRLRRSERSESLPNVLVLVLFRDLYRIELSRLRDALLDDLRTMIRDATELVA
jgi:hypothetical protein